MGIQHLLYSKSSPFLTKVNLGYYDRVNFCLCLPQDLINFNLYSYCASSLDSYTKWLTFSSISPHILHFTESLANISLTVSFFIYPFSINSQLFLSSLTSSVPLINANCIFFLRIIFFALLH